MSKRHATGSSRSRKKKKGSSYASVDLDLSDEDTEIIGVWNLSTSKTTGRISGTRKTHRHVTKVAPKPAYEELTPTVEDVGIPADPGSSKVPPTKPVVKRKKKGIKENDSTKMEDWLRYLWIVLDELLCADGLGDLESLGTCANCMKLAGEYRCKDCFGNGMFCSGCVLSSHHHHPLHRLEIWKNGFFIRATLESLGLIINLGHSGSHCPVPSEIKRILVVDVSGYHTVCVRFCRCSKNGLLESYRQLLRVGWYPASVLSPKTVFTFDLLDTYHKISLQGKLNLYDFYNAIVQKTDNYGSLKSRYHEMSRCVRQWRYLRDMKRGAAGHTLTPVGELSNVSLAVECPACPHPGRNLPTGWETETGARAWIYCLFLAINANFRLKLKLRGIKDPELGSGLAYFVDTIKFQEHLKDRVPEEEEGGGEIETCGTEFHAVNQANSRLSKDFSVTGVGAVVCRHGLVRKNGVVDIQKGERFVNMDYIFLSTVKDEKVKMIKVSYDIACRWSVKLFQRIESYSPELRISKDRFSLEYFIPKFHLPAHGSSCQTKYSFNYCPGVGRTHGENIESGWAHTNPAAVATREMGAGARHSALDSHWGGWNWRKITKFGTLLLKNLHEARGMVKRCVGVCEEFEQQTDSGTVKEWQAMKRQWERDPSEPDPYKLAEKPVNFDAAKRKLVEAEAVEATANSPLPHKLHPSSFVRMGLEIEDQQQQIIEYLRSNRERTDPQKIEVQQRRNALTKRINIWRVAQAVYMPQVSPYLSSKDDLPTSDDRQKHDSSKPETWPLFLPSAIHKDDRSPCYKGIVETEQDLRLAQLQDSLEDLRRFRRALRNLRLYFKTNMAGEGQKNQTKSRTIESGVNNQIKRAVRRYRIAYLALFELDPTGAWAKGYRELRDEDNRGPLKEIEEVRTSDGRYAPSWIWVSPLATTLPGEGSTAEQQEVNETVRHEWMTCRARADRWIEEEELLQEEMRRVVVFLEWKSRAWSEKVGVREGSCTPDIQRGVDAYARKQANIYREIATSFFGQWLPYLKACGLDTKWAKEVPWVSKVLSTKLPKRFSVIPACAPGVLPATDSPSRAEGSGIGPDARKTQNEDDDGYKRQDPCDDNNNNNNNNNNGNGNNDDNNNNSNNDYNNNNGNDDDDDDDKNYNSNNEGSDNEIDDYGDGDYDEEDDGDYNEEVEDLGGGAETNDEFGFEYDDEYMT